MTCDPEPLDWWQQPIPPHDDRPYMDGRGIMARTEELNSDMWGAVPQAICGGAAGVLAALCVAGAFMFGSWPLVPAAGLLGWLSYDLHGPWLRAKRAVADHREAMEAETEKRGKGWAQS